MGVCNCSMFCCTLLCVRSSIAIILMGKRELVALLNLFSWCPMMVERLFLAVPQGCLRFVIVVFPDHTHLLFFITVPLVDLCWYFLVVLTCFFITCVALAKAVLVVGPLRLSGGPSVCPSIHLSIRLSVRPQHFREPSLCNL